MPQVIKVQARIERSTGLSKDAVVNTFHFMVNADGTPAAVTSATSCIARLATFYQAFDQELSVLLAPLVTFKAYALAHPIPRAPIVTGTQALTLSTNPLMPAEVCFCVSYRAAPLSGEVASRRRGRIYLGPLSTFFTGSMVAGDVRPDATKATTVRNAAAALMNGGAGDDRWCVWSPTDQVAAEIREVSTDDAFDIQRRRGGAATARVRVAHS